MYKIHKVISSQINNLNNNLLKKPNNNNNNNHSIMKLNSCTITRYLVPPETVCMIYKV